MADERGPAEGQSPPSRFGGLRGRLPFGRRDAEGHDPEERDPGGRDPGDVAAPGPPAEVEGETALLRPATARDPLKPAPEPSAEPTAEPRAGATAASPGSGHATANPAATPVPPSSALPTPPIPATINPALTLGVPRDPALTTQPTATPPTITGRASMATAAAEANRPAPGPGEPQPPGAGEQSTLDPIPEAGAAPTPEPALEPETPSLRHRTPRMTPHLAVITAMATLVMLAFLLIEPSPRWLLLLGAAAVIFGLDGTLRQTWREPFASGADTSPYLFVPALYMLAVPVLIEHNIRGELAVVVGLIAGGGFGALVWAETASVRPLSPEHPIGRLIATGGTYIAGFALFSLTYVFEVGLPSAVLAVALVSTMLAVELLREGEIDPLETLGFALVTGAVMAEARWLLYYMPLDTYLAGLTLLLVFYLVTGLLHSHITRALTLPLSLEYSGIAAAGIALVVFARAAGLA